MPNERWQDSDDIVVDGNHIATGYYLLSNGGSIPQGGGKHRRHPGEEGLQKVKVIKDFGLFRKSLNA